MICRDNDHGKIDANDAIYIDFTKTKDYRKTVWFLLNTANACNQGHLYKIKARGSVLVPRANGRSFFHCKGGGGRYKIKYWYRSAPTIQLGVLQSKTLRIGIMLTKLSVQMGIKWPYH